jgi:hypothetical protein
LNTKKKRTCKPRLSSNIPVPFSTALKASFDNTLMLQFPILPSEKKTLRKRRREAQWPLMWGFTIAMNADLSIATLSVNQPQVLPVEANNGRVYLIAALPAIFLIFIGIHTPISAVFVEVFGTLAGTVLALFTWGALMIQVSCAFTSNRRK